MDMTNTATTFERQELHTTNNAMNVIRDGEIIGTLSTKGYPYVHTVTLFNGGVGSGKSMVKALAAAENA